MTNFGSIEYFSFLAVVGECSPTKSDRLEDRRGVT